MTIRQQFLQLHMEQEKELKNLFRSFVLDIVGTLNKYPDLQANIQQIRKEVAKKTTALFLAKIGDDLAPFTIIAGTLYPMSPYMAVIWKNIKLATSLAVSEQQQILLKKLKNYPMLIDTLRAASDNPFEDSILEFTQVVAEVNKYDPTRAWVSKDGYSLSDRIWQTSTEMRSKLDAYLDDAISSGKNAVDMAKELEQFLLPGQQLRTNKPYGKNVSFNAMRLSRTELSAAFSKSAIVSAKLNPFISGYKTRRGTKEPCAICDPVAQGGPYELDDVEHLPPGGTHPHCLCSITWIMKEDKPEIINTLEDKNTSLRRLANALNPRKLIEYLLSFYK